MALSGIYYGPWLGSGYQRVYLTWSATQDVSSNTSTITASLIWDNTSSSSLSSSVSKTANITIDGTTYPGSGTVGIAGGTAKTIMTASKTITHNADGTRSFSISGAFDIKFTLSGTYYASTSASGTGTLDSIARATTPTLSAGSITIGNAVTINTPRATGSSFTHKIYYKWPGGGWELIAENVATSFVWTTNINMCSGLPNSTSGNITIAADTYSGSSFIGTKTVDLTLDVPSSVIPTVSLAKSGVDLYSSEYVQGRSKVYVALTDDGSYGSSIVSRFTSVKSGTNIINTSTSNTFTSGVINYSGEVLISTVVTDSRGRTATASTIINMTPYSPPRITGFSAFRSNPDGSPNPQGAHIRITGSASISPINNTNTRVVILKHRLKGATTWSEPAWTDTSYEPSLSAIVSADINSQFEAQIYAADYFTNTTQGANIGTAFVLMDFHSSGKGVAFGKVAENENIILDISGNYRFNGVMQRNFGNNKAYGNAGLLSFWHSLETGTYFVSPGEIAGQPTDWGFMQVMKGSAAGAAGDFSVLWFSQASGAIYRKSGNASAMSGWVVIRDGDDFNSIVESGVNSNGYYMKYNNGNMICWNTFTKYSTASTAWGSMFYGEVYGLTFPATFADFPSVTASITGATESTAIVSWVGYGGLNVYGIRPVGFGAGNYSVRYIAIGRWK